MKPYFEDTQSGIVIYHGDCREILPSLPKVDLVLTDPPYGIGENNKQNLSRSCMAANTDYGDYDWDSKTPPAWVFGMLAEKADKQIIWGGNYFPLPPASCWLVWDKDNGANDFADCELAWTNLDMAVRKFTWRWHGMLQENMAIKEPRLYPTQKPRALMKWAITLAGDIKSLVDPFCGSGSSLRAAKDLGVDAIGIDKSERAVEIAANRLRQEVLQFQ